MTEHKSLGQIFEDQQQRWDQYQQPKWLWLWTAIGSALLTLAVGFGSGAWTTRWAAEKMAQDAAGAARVELVANACASNFARGADVEVRLTQFKQASLLERTAMLQNDGWVTLAGMERPMTAAAEICAEKLANMPPAGTNAMTTPAGSSG
jgi:hypothetical protein